MKHDLKKGNFRQEINFIAKNLFSWIGKESKQSRSEFKDLPSREKDWFRAIAEVGKKWIRKNQGSFVMNGVEFPRKLFGSDKKGQKSNSLSSPVSYTISNRKD